ncbi:hypothetical protein CPB83DRAFT_840709 [Crepidotus variabilis]|uniref:Uncharacterized protein n=1 Tax=Crepidotus variabilis TaxID=179855 RepID=A0A9P6E401_9AGAR|nr:hypothetical protein CPB83DRAFT_840709 [Crepidotus variabilis]
MEDKYDPSTGQLATDPGRNSEDHLASAKFTLVAPREIIKRNNKAIRSNASDDGLRYSSVNSTLLEDKVRRAAHYASECTEAEKIAIARRVQADHDVSQALQQLYRAEAAHSLDVVRKGQSSPPQQRQKPARHPLPSVVRTTIRTSRPSPSNSDDEAILSFSSLILDKAQAIQTQRRTAMTGDGSDYKKHKAGIDNTENDKKFVQPAFAQPAVPCPVLSSEILSPPAHLLKHSPHDNSSNPTSTVNNSITDKDAAPSTSISEDEINEQLHMHMKRMPIHSTCLPGCSCVFVRNPIFPSRPPSPR